MVTADQLSLGIAADCNELVIALDNLALGIGGRDQTLMRRKAPLGIANRSVVSHFDLRMVSRF